MNLLTNEQLQTLRYSAQGLENKEISKLLGISTGAVQSQINYAHKAIKAKNSSNAALTLAIYDTLNEGNSALLLNRVSKEDCIQYFKDATEEYGIEVLRDAFCCNICGHSNFTKLEGDDWIQFCISFGRLTLSIKGFDGIDQ